MLTPEDRETVEYNSTKFSWEDKERVKAELRKMNEAGEKLSPREKLFAGIPLDPEENAILWKEKFADDCGMVILGRDPNFKPSNNSDDDEEEDEE